MAYEAAAIRAPTQAEMMRMLASTTGAGLSGLMEGIIVRVAPQMGAAAPVLTWGALIGTPVVGALGSLFTRGVLGDVLHGVAAGGVGVVNVDGDFFTQVIEAHGL